MNRRERRAAAAAKPNGPEDKLLPTIFGNHMRSLFGPDTERVAKHAFEKVIATMGGKIPATAQHSSDVKLSFRDGSTEQIIVTIDCLNAQCVQVGLPSDFTRTESEEEYKEHYRDMPTPPALH